jgi:hypothetical protein
MADERRRHVGITLGNSADQHAWSVPDQTWWVQARLTTSAVVVSATAPAAGNGQNGYGEPGPNENRLDSPGRLGRRRTASTRAVALPATPGLGDAGQLVKKSRPNSS